MTGKATKQPSEIDWNDVNPEAQEEMPLTLPVAFWRHGDSKLKKLGETDINYIGGLFFTYDQAGEGAEIEGWAESSFQGEEEDVYGLGAHTADITIIRYRRRWFHQGEERTEYRPWNGYEKGFRAQMQAIGLIKGYDNPVCFSFKGIAVSHVQSILRERYRQIMSVVNREAPEGKSLPPYALWIRITAGKHEKVGQSREQSEVTMPEIVLPKGIDRNFALSCYVGREYLIRSQELFLEADKWAHEWEVVPTSQPAKQVTPQQVATEMQAPANSDPYEGGQFNRDTDEIPF